MRFHHVLAEAVSLIVVCSLMPAFAMQRASGDAIRRAVSGNTVTFPDSKTGEPIFIYMAPDGTFESQFRGQTRTGTWWIKAPNLLCRVYDDGSRRSCRTLFIADDLLYFRGSKRSPFNARVLSGKQYRLDPISRPKARMFTRKGVTYHQEFVSHPGDPAQRVELYWARPEGQGRWPAILFVHGHQIGIRPGGKTYLDFGRLAAMLQEGYVAAAVSQPGYGQSGGAPDFCGSFSQNAILAAIRFLRQKTFVDPDKIGLFGYSRGAIVASMVATQDAQLAAVVLGGGTYDFNLGYPTELAGLDANIRSEAGVTPEAFKARSAAHHVEQIKSPILLLHGAEDDRFKADYVLKFARDLKAHNVVVQNKIFDGVGHGIPIRQQYQWILPFLREHLRHD